MLGMQFRSFKFCLYTLQNIQNHTESHQPVPIQEIRRPALTPCAESEVIAVDVSLAAVRRHVELAKVVGFPAVLVVMPSAA